MERFNIVIGWDQLCQLCLKKGKTNKMRLDVRFSRYVCIHCGWSVNSWCRTIYDKFGENGGRWSRGYTYNRTQQFKDRMERKGCLSATTQMIMANRFIYINRFYMQILLRDEKYGIDRKNTLKYEYLIKKMLQLLRKHDSASKFKAPKTKRKLEEYERIWRFICEHFKWKFYDAILIRKMHKEIKSHSLRLLDEGT